jgi:hypothetical protein
LEKWALKILGKTVMDIFLDVLKWVVVILIAGFIGQFGKSLSLHIIGYFKKKKEKEKVGAPLLSKDEETKPAPLSQEESFTTEQEPSTVNPVGDSPVEKDPSSASQERDYKTTKKALKAQQKAKKKLEKARKKE